MHLPSALLKWKSTPSTTPAVKRERATTEQVEASDQSRTVPSILERLPENIWENHLSNYLDAADLGRVALAYHGGLDRLMSRAAQAHITNALLPPSVRAQPSRSFSREIVLQGCVETNLNRGAFTATMIAGGKYCMNPSEDAGTISPLGDRALYYARDRRAFAVVKFGDGQPSCDALTFSKDVNSEHLQSLPSLWPEHAGWSSDGQTLQLIVTERGQQTYLWWVVDSVVQTPEALPGRHTGGSSSAKFLLLEVTNENAFSVWSTESLDQPAKLLSTLPNPKRNARGFFSPNGDLFAYAVGKRVEVRKLVENMPLVASVDVSETDVSEGCTGLRADVAFSPDNAFVFMSAPRHAEPLAHGVFRLTADALVVATDLPCSQPASYLRGRSGRAEMLVVTDDEGVQRWRYRSDLPASPVETTPLNSVFWRQNIVPGVSGGSKALLPTPLHSHAMLLDLRGLVISNLQNNAFTHHEKAAFAREVANWNLSPIEYYRWDTSGSRLSFLQSHDYGESFRIMSYDFGGSARLGATTQKPTEASWRTRLERFSTRKSLHLVAQQAMPQYTGFVIAHR